MSSKRNLAAGVAVLGVAFGLGIISNRNQIS